MALAKLVDMAVSDSEQFSADQVSIFTPAVIAPLRRGMRTNGYWDAGLFDTTGAPIPQGHLNLHKLTSNPTAEVFATASAAAVDLPGAWLFAGVMPRKTGHIVLNALGRLWMTDHLPEDVGLLYVTHLYDAPEHPFLNELLHSLGVNRPCKLVSSPSRVEALHVGPDGFSSALMGQAAPQVARWLRTRASPAQARAGGRKLYITRGRLSPLVGRYLCEDVLEANLAQAGYEIIVPEAMSLRDQLDLYAQADVVIAAEGTAVHIAALALPETARLVVIQRRHEVPEMIRNHLASFLPTPPTYIDAVDQMHWPEERAVNVALTTLDFDRLRKSLTDHGLIDSSAVWRLPSADQIAASRAEGRGVNARFLTLAEREAFLRAFRRRRRKRRKG